MQILQVVGIGLISTIIIIILKKQKPEAAMQVGIISGIVIFALLSSKLYAVADLLEKYADRAGIEASGFSVVLKIMGIAYIAEFGAEVCRDAGESAIASKIELAGKVIIVVLAVPIITSLLDMIMKIMP